MSKDWEKSFWETFNIYAGNQSKRSLLNIHTSDTHLLVFANRYCPDSLDFSNNVTAWVNHHKNKKTPIKTVSITQARMPVYQSSVDSNTKYEKFLSKMYSLLDS